ncbi:hypothetical protein ETD85_54175, partial [Nonomuraea zeae]
MPQGRGGAHAPLLVRRDRPRPGGRPHGPGGRPRQLPEGPGQAPGRDRRRGDLGPQHPYGDPPAVRAGRRLPADGPRRALPRPGRRQGRHRSRREPGPLKVAALQAPLAGSAAGDLPEAIARCAREAVELLVLPECYFGGMPRDRSAAEAVAMASPYSGLASALRDCPPALTVVAGFTERAADGRLHSAAAVFRAGRPVGAVARKLFPREPVFSPGDDLPLHRHREHAFGVVICNDANFVEPSRLLALAGSEGGR